MEVEAGDEVDDEADDEAGDEAGDREGAEAGDGAPGADSFLARLERAAAESGESSG